METNNTITMGSSVHKKTIAATMLVLVLILGGYTWVKYEGKFVRDSLESQKGNDVIVDQTKRNSDNKLGIPDNFPREIPIEAGNIIESYRVAYSGRGALQYTLSYHSEKTKSEKWDEYSDFMRQNGYTINAESSNRGEGTIAGVKNRNMLIVRIVNENDRTIVRINLIEQEA